MEIKMSGGRIKLKKELNDLDKLVIDFTKILDRNKIKYVLVSGYVSILFGRSRSSEDVDVIAKKIFKRKFLALWKSLLKENFHCIVPPDSVESAYENYLTKRASLKFSRKGQFVPNIEFKFPKVEELDNWVLDHSVQVLLNGKPIRISPVELQIPYKLYLGTEKDIEDALHLYKLFKDKLNQKLLRQFLVKLDKEDDFNKYLA
jgi:hypothetical protein